MEQRLIDANALKNTITKHSYIVRDRINSTGEGMFTVGIMQAIDEQPTIDAVPVRHGKWIIRDNPGTGWYRITCSVCDEDVTSNAPIIGFFPNAKVPWDYCPNCGAKMK